MAMRPLRTRGAIGSPTSITRLRGRILVIDDDSDAAQLLSVCLKFAGYDVCIAESWPQVLWLVRRGRIDAALLEVTTLGLDGPEVLTRLRAAGVAAPILFVTVCDAVETKIRSLTAGADDYVTKPFQIEEVVARLEVVLRRTRPSMHEEWVKEAHLLRYADLVVDENAHEVRRGDDPISLTPTEFNLLRVLMLNAEMVLSKHTILQHIRPARPDASIGTVDSFVSLLRRKVDYGRPSLVHTLWGRGYMLRADRPRAAHID